MWEITNVPVDKTAPSIGVVLFFVLSGFLMAHLYLPERFTLRSGLRFAAARFGRIYPLFAIVVIAAGLVSTVTPDGIAPFWITSADIPAHLLLYGQGGTIWTIAVECQFYGLFVLAWALTLLAPPRWRDAVFAAICIATIVLCLLTNQNEGRINLLRYLHIFAMGGLVAVVARHWGARLYAFGRVAFPVTIAIYIAYYFTLNYRYDAELVYDDPLFCVTIAVLVLSAVVAERSWLGRLLGAAPLVFLGEISFGVYLLHRPVMFFWTVAFGGALGGVVLQIVLTIVTLALAWLAHIAIERPARRLIRAGAEALLATGQRPSPAV